MPFAFAAALASATASGTMSHPRTAFASAATLRPSAPTPQNRSRTVSVLAPEKPHARVTAAARRSVWNAFVWKKDAAESSNRTPRSVAGIVRAPRRTTDGPSETAAASPGSAAEPSCVSPPSDFARFRRPTP